MKAAEPSDGGTLCGSCAMCCNGTLFGRAKLEPHEAPIRAGDGLELTEVEGQRFFVQPCAYESCGRCTIYEKRFEVCRAFRCKLLARYESGEIDLEQAQATVREALTVRAAVAGADPAAVSYGERSRLRNVFEEKLANDPGSERNSIARRLLGMVVLDAFLDRWFWARDKTQAEP